jgi:hypothetical protein
VTGALTDALVYNPAGVGQPLATSTTGTSGTTGTVAPNSTNPNVITRAPVDNVLLGQAYGAYGLTSGSAPSVGQANNVIKAYG